MAEDLWMTLLRYHREVAVPEIVTPLREEIAARHRETQTNFDGLWKRFDRLDALNHEISATLARIEQRIS